MPSSASPPPLEPGKQFLRGLCMGAADVVPGVSGGTVAFLVGIYERLIHAISHIDRTWLQFLWQRRFREAIQHADLAFLAVLGTGILSGVLLTAITVHRLLSLDETRPFTLAVFFGVIAASGVLMVRRAVELHGRWGIAHAVGAAISLLLAGYLALSPVPVASEGSPALWFVFAGGAIAICAMLLPGISGAMILLLLGLYGHLTGIPDALREGESVPANLLLLIIFAAGCATGLACFSRFLRWLLARHAGLTLAILCGLMFGSLPRLWPYQFDATPQIADFEDKQLTPVWPSDLGWETWGPLLAVLLSASTLFAIHYRLTRPSKGPSALSTPTRPKES